MKARIIVLFAWAFLSVQSYGIEVNWGAEEYKPYGEIYEETVEQIVKDRVPDEFEKAFLYYSDNDKMRPLRLHFLAIAEVESGWVWMRGHSQNQNGSWDVGPMGLNTYNIENEQFRKAYTPEDMSLIESDEILWMVMCMNYFTEIFYWKDVKEDAFFIYNAGYGRYINDTLPAMTIRYHRWVSDYLEMYQERSMIMARIAHRKTRVQTYIKNVEMRFKGVATIPDVHHLLDSNDFRKYTLPIKPISTTDPFIVKEDEVSIVMVDRILPRSFIVGFIIKGDIWHLLV